MSTPACVSRTWVTPDELVTCKLEHGHDGKHEADASFGLISWREPSCRFVINNMEYVWSLEGTRDLAARLLRQIEGLDPGSLVEEARREMIEAHRDLVDLIAVTDALGGDGTEAEPIAAARSRRQVAHATWRSLVVAARAAKVGGT